MLITGAILNTVALLTYLEVWGFSSAFIGQNHSLAFNADFI